MIHQDTHIGHVWAGGASVVAAVGTVTFDDEVRWWISTVTSVAMAVVSLWIFIDSKITARRVARKAEEGDAARREREEDFALAMRKRDQRYEQRLREIELRHRLRPEKDEGVPEESEP